MLLYSDRIMIQYIIWYCMYSKKLYDIILLYIRQWQIILYWVMFMYVCLYVSVHMSFNKSEWLHNQHIYKQRYIYIYTHSIYVYVFWFKKKHTPYHVICFHWCCPVVFISRKGAKRNGFQHGPQIAVTDTVSVQWLVYSCGPSDSTSRKASHQVCAPLIQNGDMGVLGVWSLEVQGGSNNSADSVDWCDL